MLAWGGVPAAQGCPPSRGEAAPAQSPQSVSGTPPPCPAVWHHPSVVTLCLLYGVLQKVHAFRIKLLTGSQLLGSVVLHMQLCKGKNCMYAKVSPLYRVSLAQALELSREVEAANAGDIPLEERLALYDRLVAALNEAKSSVRHSISGGAQPRHHPIWKCMPSIFWSIHVQRAPGRTTDQYEGLNRAPSLAGQDCVTSGQAFGLTDYPCMALSRAATLERQQTGHVGHGKQMT